MKRYRVVVVTDLETTEDYVSNISKGIESVVRHKLGEYYNIGRIDAPRTRCHVEEIVQPAAQELPDLVEVASQYKYIED